MLERLNLMVCLYTSEYVINKRHRKGLFKKRRKWKEFRESFTLGKSSGLGEDFVCLLFVWLVGWLVG